METKLEDAFKNKKIKTIIDFDRKEFNSIKSIALKVNMNINVTSRFINGKMLMFAKIWLKCFVYDMIDVLCSLTEEVKMIYDKYDIIKCYIYLILSDTDICSCFFNFICKKECNVKESESRNLVFEILKQSKIAERLDVSGPFWSQFENTQRKCEKTNGALRNRKY